jgi:hypothetical protein
MKNPKDAIKTEFRKETLRIPQEQQWTQTFQIAMALFNKGETKTCL